MEIGCGLGHWMGAPLYIARRPGNLLALERLLAE